MTSPRHPNDQELFGLIERSMSHYRLERPIPEVIVERSARWVSFGGLAAAALAGAVLAVAVLAGVNGLRFPPGFGSSSTPIPEFVAAERCLREDGQIPEQWYGPGEDEAAVREHLRNLPLLFREDREIGSLVVYGDNRLIAACTFQAVSSGEPDFTGLHVLRENPVDVVKVGSAVTGGGSVDASGDPVPSDLPFMLVQGFASADVTRVEIVLGDGSRVPAPVADGVWVAWWQRNLGTNAVRAYGLDGSLLIEVPYVHAPLLPVGPDGVIGSEQSPTAS